MLLTLLISCLISSTSSQLTPPHPHQAVTKKALENPAKVLDFFQANLDKAIDTQQAEFAVIP
jgi:hypothetical protein